MAFNMSNATYGRDSSGIQALKEEYALNLERTLKSLRGDKYNELKKVIRENWSGADAERFLHEIDKKISDVESKIKTYKTKIDTALTGALTDFLKFQDSNKV